MFTDYVEDASSPVLLADTTRRLRASFRLVNTTDTVANTLRRAILVHTPSVGFRTEPYDASTVEISINTTPYPNEYIALRVGMIPVAADPLTFDPELFTFDLDVENRGKEVRKVYAKDFKVYMRDPANPLEAPVQVDTATLFPPDPITGDSLYILDLQPQWNPTAAYERIKMKAKAVISTGSENIRWSPVSQASYEYTRDMDEAKATEVFTQWLETQKKIKPEDLGKVDPARLEDLKAEFNTMEVQRCYKTNEIGEPNDFTFHVESIGVQNISTIVKSALVSCEVLVTKYQDMDGLLPDNVRVQQGDSRFTSIDFIFQHESHTLGNLVANWLIDNAINESAGSAITYAGYKMPHPSRPEIFIRVGVKDGLDPELQKQTARRAIAEACKALKSMFRDMTAAWMRIASPPSSAGAAADE
jgi:DNA-directed RNA polymerase subunit L/DNA-directed RNA polymerase alpha subunit